jgi:hypothetical protein
VVGHALAAISGAAIDRPSVVSIAIRGIVMKKLAMAALAITALAAESAAMAGSPHFVSVSVERQGDNLYVSGKEAGLGNETQVHIVVSAEAACLNPGQKFPKAENKEAFSAEGDFPIQNGQATFNLTLIPDFKPHCSPPMSVVWGAVTISDVEHNVTKTISGTF